MKETGIIFSTSMVQAYQQGLKTVTRRTRGLEEINENPNDWILLDLEEGHIAPYYRFEDKDTGYRIFVKCPFGGKGGVLRVKETWREPICKDSGYIDYRADYINAPLLIKWKSPLFMPKEASRYFLTLVSDPIPERIQEISWEDCHAEGILRFDREHPDPTNGGVGYNRGAVGLPMRYESKAAYMDLWDSLNGKKYPWASNPWLWPLRFERYKP